MPRGVRTIDPLSLGSGARLPELFKMPRWLAVLFLGIREIFRHYLTTLSFFFVFYLWYKWSSSSLLEGSNPFWGLLLALATVLLLWTATIGTYWVVLGGRWKTAWWYFQVKRKWRKTLSGVGLKERNGQDLPTYSRVRPVKGGLRMNVNMSKATRTVLDLQAEADTIAEVIGALRFEVFPLGPGKARFVLLWTPEPLISAESIHSNDEDDIPDDGYGDYSKLVIGRTGSGNAVLSLVLSMLIAGLPGSGKSTLLRVLFRTIIRNRIPHELYVIDPAGGVELGELEHYPHTVAYCEEPEDAEKVIKKAHADLKARRATMKANGDRKIIPSPEFPLRLILIDEMLSLPTDQLTNMQGNLATIAIQGRKACTVVVGLTALSQVDAIGRIRDAFPQRVCLATGNPEGTDACLGKGAEAAGAKCSEIPLNTPGVGYIKNPNGRGYTRFRTTESDGPLLDADYSYRGKGGGSNNSNRQCAHYKYYDVNGRLLYTGKAFNPDNRAKQHASSKLWWGHVDHTRTVIDWYVNEEEALKAELHCIKNDKPLHNVRDQVGGTWKGESAA